MTSIALFSAHIFVIATLVSTLALVAIAAGSVTAVRVPSTANNLAFLDSATVKRTEDILIPAIGVFGFLSFVSLLVFFLQV